jgi:DNA polymerase elongation subunit (family B)
MQGVLPMDEEPTVAQAPSGEGELSPQEPNSLESLIFGSDPTPGIVAVEAVDSTLWLYIREGERLRVHQEPFQPWLLSDQPMTLPGVHWQELTGDFCERPALRYLARCANRDAFDQLRQALREEHRATIAYSSLARQYLMLTGKTLFKGMTFDQLHRVQLDIETTTLKPDQPGAAILMIALSDNRGYEELLEGDESRILRQLVERIQTLDPDVIEGHNLFGFDIPFLVARAEHYGIPLTLGRDGSPLRIGSSRTCVIGANSRAYKPAFLHGRHLLDTYLAVQRFDIGRGELESYGLKESAQSLGLALEERIYLERDQIPHLWQTDPDMVRRYCLQDVHETRRLAELVLPTEFYQCQMVPDTLQNLATIGTGEKVNLLFLRAYLQAGHAIPLPQEPRDYPGGYTEVRIVGLVQRVVKADVESLYPSLMLQFGIKPEADRLNVFLPLLRELTHRRLDAKTRARQSQGAEASYWDGLQASFKILINSFYGYLGAPFHFNDYNAAETVTLKGQEIVKHIAAEIKGRGGRVIEIDTDGVYFQPPEGIETEEQEKAFVAQIAETLPEGIRLIHDGRYQAMLSVKTKNYVLMGYDGKLIYKGASLRSRADERFGREFISQAIQWLLESQPERVAEEYRRLAHAILDGEVPIEQLCRRERITEKSRLSYHPLHELARRFQVGDYINVYRRKDGSLGLLEEYAGDEDREHYVEKLYKFACRLQELFPEFDRLFPKPQTLIATRNQASLFD